MSLSEISQEYGVSRNESGNGRSNLSINKNCLFILLLKIKLIISRICKSSFNKYFELFLQIYCIFVTYLLQYNL